MQFFYFKKLKVKIKNNTIITINMWKLPLKTDSYKMCENGRFENQVNTKFWNPAQVFKRWKEKKELSRVSKYILIPGPDGS